MSIVILYHLCSPAAKNSFKLSSKLDVVQEENTTDGFTFICGDTFLQTSLEMSIKEDNPLHYE